MRLGKKEGRKLELFLGQGHITIGNEVVCSALTPYVGHSTFLKNSHTSPWFPGQTELGGNTKQNGASFYTFITFHSVSYWFLLLSLPVLPLYIPVL